MFDRDIKALVRVIALAITDDSEKAEKVLAWAYEGLESKRGGRGKAKVDGEAVERIYALYPSSVTRPEGRKATLKSTKDKIKIASILSTMTEDRLAEIINKYVKDVNPPYTKMFSTFLNNLPDFEEEVEQPSICDEQGNEIFASPEMESYIENRRKYYEDR